MHASRATDPVEDPLASIWFFHYAKVYAVFSFTYKPSCHIPEASFQTGKKLSIHSPAIVGSRTTHNLVSCDLQILREWNGVATIVSTEYVFLPCLTIIWFRGYMVCSPWDISFGRVVFFEIRNLAFRSPGNFTEMLKMDST